MSHPRFNRRTGTRVRHGKVERTNRVHLTALEGVVLDRESPRDGYRHLVSKRDLLDFIELIPDWHRLSQGLEAIWLGRGDPGADGYYEHFEQEGTGRIVLHAWPKELWQELDTAAFRDHQEMLDRLGVAYEEVEEGVLCRFTASQAKAYVLLHVFMHELGHHRDAMLRKGRQSGEAFAESYANSSFDQLFDVYVAKFGRP